VPGTNPVVDPVTPPPVAPPPVTPPPVTPPPVAPPPVAPPPVAPPPVAPPPVVPPPVDPLVDLIATLGPNPLSNPAALQQFARTLLQTYSTDQLLVMLQSPALRAQVPMLASMSPATALLMLQNFARM
jgi:hypothetical protein